MPVDTTTFCVTAAWSPSVRLNCERRSFALLRPIAGVTAQERIRDLVLEAYAEYEAAAPADR